MTPLIITQSKLICCCGAKTWSKVIACIEIFCVLALVIFRYVLMSIKTDMESEDVASDEPVQKFEFVLYAYLYAHPTYQLAEGATNILLGIILLVGAHMGKPVLLLIWMVSAALGLLLILMFVIVQLYVFIMGSSTFILVAFIVASVIFLLKTFFLYVVFVHRRELVVLKTQLDSIVHYNSVHVDVIKHNNY